MPEALAISHTDEPDPTTEGTPQEPIPRDFLEVRVRRLDLAPALIGLCAGYENGEWRSQQLAKHLMEWLPEFALNYRERQALGHHNAVRLMRAAARTIYESNKFEKRGEFGELLLHVAIRQVFKTLPAISKIYYKDSVNDTVKGFDAVHVVVGREGLELWLGEAKFYKDVGAAISAVIDELRKHSEAEYLRGEFAAIVNKVDGRWPHGKKLKKLLDPNTSLDEIFDAVSIPVLLTYDSDTVKAHDRVCDEYERDFEREVIQHHGTFASKGLPQKVRVHLFLVPLKSKKELQGKLDTELRKWQAL